MSIRALFLAFSLLASAATADAECSWVLWEHTWKDSSRNQWTPTGSVETRAECEKGKAAMERQHRQLTELLIKTNPAKYDLSEHTQYICLTDTVDPRAPKGK